MEPLIGQFSLESNIVAKQCCKKCPTLGNIVRRAACGDQIVISHFSIRTWRILFRYQKPQQQNNQMKPVVSLVSVSSSLKVRALATKPNGFLLSSSSLKVRASLTEPNSFLARLFLSKQEKKAKRTKIAYLEATKWEEEI